MFNLPSAWTMMTVSAKIAASSIGFRRSRIPLGERTSLTDGKEYHRPIPRVVSKCAFGIITQGIRIIRYSVFSHSSYLFVILHNRKGRNQQRSSAQIAVHYCQLTFISTSSSATKATKQQLLSELCSHAKYPTVGAAIFTATAEKMHPSGCKNNMNSCAKSENELDLKKSSVDISIPSHSYMVDDIVVLLFLPLTMLLTSSM